MKATLSAALLLCCAITATAAPPQLTLPAEARPANGYVRVVPKTDAVSVTYVGLDGVYPFPSEELKDPRNFVLPAAGLKDGTYRFIAVAASKTGEQVTGQFSVVIGLPTPPPIPAPVDPPLPPVPVDGSAKLYFLIVRADGPASPAFTNAMALPEWNQLRAAGHQVKDKSAAEAAALGAVVPPAQLPAVVTLLISADKASSSIVRPAVPMPTDGAGVLKLATLGALAEPRDNPTTEGN